MLQTISNVNYDFEDFDNVFKYYSVLFRISM